MRQVVCGGSHGGRVSCGGCARRRLEQKRGELHAERGVLAAATADVAAIAATAAAAIFGASHVLLAISRLDVLLLHGDGPIDLKINGRAKRLDINFE